MKMEKPTVEVVRLNSSDVIATSGGGADTFTVSNFNNGTPKDLTVTYMGNPYGDWDSLADALRNAGHDIFDPTDTAGRNGNPHTIANWYNLDEYETSYANLNSNVNGSYTWYNNKWYHN